MCEKALKHILDDTYRLFKKTLNYHWNIRSKSFMELHLFFGTQYSDLLEAADTIAEHMRAKNMTIEASCSTGCSDLTPIKPAFSDQEMLKDLLQDHDKLIKCLEVEITALQSKDLLTQDLFIERGRAHQKMAWMLRSFQS